MVGCSNDPRVQRLAGRVRWLDSNRRLLAIVLAALVVPFLMSRVDDALGSDWPDVHMTLLGAMLGFIVWWVIEVGLVWLTAIWETDCDQLVRSGGLPAARLRRRK
jgi:hypothetical protein